jgi:hypothetical protein
MIKIDSTCIESLGYDPATSELYVKFNSGMVYIYKGVSQLLFNQMCVAPSTGKFFRENIVDEFHYTISRYSY